MNKAEPIDRPEIMLGLHSLHRLPSCHLHRWHHIGTVYVERPRPGAAGSLPAAPEPEPPYPSASPSNSHLALEHMDDSGKTGLSGVRAYWTQILNSGFIRMTDTSINDIRESVWPFPVHKLIIMQRKN